MTGAAAAGMPGFLAGYLLRTTVVLTLALAAAAAARRCPAAVRHFILSTALIGLLLLPFLTLAPVGWRSPLVPRWMAPAAAVRTQATAGATSFEPGPTSGVEANRVMFVDDTSTQKIAAPAAGTHAEDPDAVALPFAGRAVVPVRPAQPAAPSNGAGRRAVDLVLVFLWAAGMAVLALRLGIGLAGALRLSREGTPLGGPSWRALLERFLVLVPLRRRVRLKSHPGVLIPLTWGWRRPTVLMPRGADEWSEEDRSSALFHELSHIKRLDFAVMLLVRASLALFWWNPLGWVAYRELLKEQELACDELVLRAGIKPSSYAASLLAFRRSAAFRWNPSAALLGLLGRAPFQERLAAILRQKLILTEVKMKTKIMLALALGLAVAIVGTARPVAGNAANEAATVLVEPAAPAPAAFEAALLAAPAAGQEVTATAVQVKEKAKEKEKEKDKGAVAKTIVISPKGGDGKPIEIVITEGDEMKTLVLDKPLTITKEKDGQALVLSVDGKEIRVLKGEPLRLEIKGGGLQVVKEGRAVEIGEGGAVTVVKEGGDEARQVVYVSKVKPEVVVETKPEVVVEARPHVIMKMGQDLIEGKPAAWTVVEGGKAGGKNFAISSLASDKEMLEKVRALEEQVQAIKAKKMDLAALEDSLKKLEAELQAKEEKLKQFQLKFDKAPGEYTVVKRVAGEEISPKSGVWVIDEDKAAKAGQARVMVGIEGKDSRSISLIFTGAEGDAGQAAFERAGAALKKGLPEGYKIAEQKYDADKGTMTFKVEAPEGGKTETGLVKKLVESVKDALKTGK